MKKWRHGEDEKWRAHLAFPQPLAESRGEQWRQLSLVFLDQHFGCFRHALVLERGHLKVGWWLAVGLGHGQVLRAAFIGGHTAPVRSQRSSNLSRERDLTSRFRSVLARAI